MNIRIEPSNLSGGICVPPSKSLLHRGLFCAALAGDLSLCKLPSSLSDDIRTTFACLHKFLANDADFFCSESGTTLRLLIPVAAAHFCHARFSGAGRLPQRPLAEYRDAFANHGVTCSFPSDGFLPLRLSGRLTSGVFHLPGHISSQYISGILLALPLLDGDSEIILTSPLESAPYVEMTCDVMRFFNIEVDGLRVRGRQRYAATKPYVAEPDFSQAAFWQLAQFLGHAIMLRNLPAHTSQGDAVFATLLNGPREIDVSQIPDLVPALAAAAAITYGDTHLVNAGRLRLKESDRIASTCDMLRAFGVEVSFTDASITICGKPNRTLNACTIDAHRDHRIVMAAAMLATRASGSVTIFGSDAVAKSYPSFFEHYTQAGGIAHELHLGT